MLPTYLWRGAGWPHRTGRPSVQSSRDISRQCERVARGRFPGLSIRSLRHLKVALAATLAFTGALGLVISVHGSGLMTV